MWKNKPNNVDSLNDGLSTQSESAENSDADTEEMRSENDDVNDKEDEADDMSIV